MSAGVLTADQEFTALRNPADSRLSRHAVSSVYRVGETVAGLCLDAPVMVAVPPGRFQMGSAPAEVGHMSSEAPCHEVQISYWLAISRSTLSFDDWYPFAQETGRAMPDDAGWGRGQRPVINVSWQDAQAYLAWLNERAGLDAADPGRYRLLSEAEWEYACRAGEEQAFVGGCPPSTDIANYNGSFVWPTGRELSLRERLIGWLRGRAVWLERTVPVMSFQANAWGLYNMRGNVWEWVQDGWRSDYRAASADGGAAAATVGADLRVLRGGSWRSGPESLRAAQRYSMDAALCACDVGFRIARTLS